MKKEFKAVAMPCTEEQFNSIKKEFESIKGVVVKFCEMYKFENYPYITNNYSNKLLNICNINSTSISSFNRTILKSFDKQAFLEACGWENPKQWRFKTLQEFKESVIKWAEDRNLFCHYNGTTIENQKIKFFEEFGELCRSLARGKCIKDDIGDCAVVAVILEELQRKNMSSEYFLKIGDFQLSTLMLIPVLVIQERFKDAITYLQEICNDKNVDFNECLSVAFNEISPRKGKFINGFFVKESDFK